MNKKNILIFSAALSIVILDQLTKFIVRQNFQLGQSISIIKNIFHLTYIANSGSAFGLFKGYNLFFMLFSIAVIGIAIYSTKRISGDEKALQLAVGLLLGGTIGNLMDRIFHGSVIDFLDFRIWPVFNVADSAVTISAIFLIILLWKK